jgi:glyoxylase-like metal-dependent hydrolase (beta-lactamase superfamily II)
LDRRAFLRLAGMAVAGGIAALTATSPRRDAAASGSGFDRAEARFTQPPAQARSRPNIAGRTPTVDFGAIALHRKAKRSAEVVPDLFRLPDIRGVNAYLWMPRINQSAPGEAILFDCGWPWSGRALAASLAALGCGPGDLRAIAITHGDFDHAGPLAALIEESRAEIIAHELEAPRLASDQWRALPGNGASLDPMILAAGPAYRLWPPRPVQVTRPIQDDAAIGDGWIAVHTPGHTPGHTAFFHPATKVLIAGDALGSERRGHLRLPKRIYAEDWEAALRSVRKLADLQPEVICFGHGRELHQASGMLEALAGSLPAEESSRKIGRL